MEWERDSRGWEDRKLSAKISCAKKAVHHVSAGAVLMRSKPFPATELQLNANTRGPRNLGRENQGEAWDVDRRIGWKSLKKSISLQDPLQSLHLLVDDSSLARLWVVSLESNWTKEVPYKGKGHSLEVYRQVCSFLLLLSLMMVG